MNDSSFPKKKKMNDSASLLLAIFWLQIFNGYLIYSGCAFQWRFFGLNSQHLACEFLWGVKNTLAEIVF